MAYRLPGERQQLDLDGPSVEVEPCRAWAIQRVGLDLALAFEQAKSPAAELAAFAALGRFVLSEAMPVWDICDHRGPIPLTETGWLRLPVDLAMSITAEWLTTANPKTSAVDELVAPGPARDELNRRLRSVKPRKAA